ncbi:hypothetical protein [Helicobacter sp.]|uniref:hypothetical protein n=1 Tax=Helicobacter sp. TaxID=218 RepID=UPI003890E2FA
MPRIQRKTLSLHKVCLWQDLCARSGDRPVLSRWILGFLMKNGCLSKVSVEINLRHLSHKRVKDIGDFSQKAKILALITHNL